MSTDRISYYWDKILTGKLNSILLTSKCRYLEPEMGTRAFALIIASIVKLDESKQ